MPHPHWASKKVAAQGYCVFEQTSLSSSFLLQAEVKLHPETEKKLCFQSTEWPAGYLNADEIQARLWQEVERGRKQAEFGHGPWWLGVGKGGKLPWKTGVLLEGTVVAQRCLWTSFHILNPYPSLVSIKSYTSMRKGSLWEPKVCFWSRAWVPGFAHWFLLVCITQTLAPHLHFEFCHTESIVCWRWGWDIIYTFCLVKCSCVL